MEDSRQTYLRLCKEAGMEPQECVLAQLQATAVSSRLDLSGQSLTVESCSALGRTLQKDTLFTELILGDCMLSEESAKLLLNGLCLNTMVKVLNLKGNTLRGAGAEALGKLLVKNKTIQRLILEWNALGMWEEGFSIFCEGLSSNSSLTQLDLRNNQINHQGAAELALALKRNSVLQELDLRWNNIGLLGSRSLLDALKQNRTLIQLEMTGNNIPSDILKAIEQSMEHNTDRLSTQRESHTRAQVLTKEIQFLKDEKGRQFLNLMETIDKQRDEMGRSCRSTSIRLGQLQETLKERQSTVNSLTAKLQMTEAALALSEHKVNNIGETLTRVKLEKTELMDRLSREMKKEQEECVLREGKLMREINCLSEKNHQFRVKLEESDRRCKAQQDQIFELKQELTNSTAELKIRLVQAEERLEMEKKRSKQALEDMDSLRQKEKYRVDMPGSSSAFIPTINAITTSQDLQWMVQPTVITSMSNPYSRSHPYSLSVPSGPGLLSHTPLARPGVIRSIGDARGRRKRDEQLTPEEEEKRRVRRERNKLAAAKCRNRRRELTEMLQGETEKLEEEKADLQKEIETLQKEKDKLEFMLVAHNPVCKLPPEERHQGSHAEQCAPLSLTMRSGLVQRPAPPLNALNPVVVKQEPMEDDDEEDGDDCIKVQHSVIKPICLSGGGVGMYCTDGTDSLNTPVVAASTPISTPSNPSLIFTYPSMLEPESPSPSSESCSKAHRRSSSSGDQSSDSLNSPTLLAL